MTQYFPIDTPTACKLKWAWSTIILKTGKTKSCHRVEADQIDIDSFDSFHNTTTKVQHRELMLQGKWPDGNCNYCKSIEDADGQSDRINHNNIPGCVPDELHTNLSATIVQPKILEVYFDNICNMGCVYCSKNLSSVLEHEYNKFGDYAVNSNDSDNIIAKSYVTDSEELINLRKEKLFLWLEKNHKSLERFHFLGGEPFFQSEFEKMLEFFERHPCPNLEYNIVTNLKVSTKKLKSYIQRLETLVNKKHLKRIDITCSIDCFGKEQEYVRYGIDLSLWKENFAFLASMPWIYLSVNQTLSSLTLKTVPELVEYLNSCKHTSNREISHYFNLISGGSEKHVQCQHPKYFGPGYFDKDFDNILQCMQSDTWQEKEAKNHMLGLKKSLQNAQRDNCQIKRLTKFLDEVDTRRNLSWRSTFSWLEDELEHVV